VKRIVVLLLALSILFWASPGLSGTLDTKRLLSVACERLKRDKKVEGLRPEHLSVYKKIPIKLGELDLWAVRVHVRLPDQKAQLGVLDLVTDDKVRWQFESVSDLRSGQPLLEKALAELAKVDIDPHMGQVIFRGKGKNTVILVTDNFCPYCRTAYETLPRVYGDQMKELVLIYLPLNAHPGAELACAVSSYVHQQKHRQPYARQVDDFIFKELNAPATKDLNEANAAVYEALKSRFPWFAREFSGLSTEKALEKLRAGSNIEEQRRYAANLGVIGTPIIFVNGMRIDGLDWKKFERFLSY
jgi:protein-disulfide isomerase